MDYKNYYRKITLSCFIVILIAGSYSLKAQDQFNVFAMEYASPSNSLNRMIVKSTISANDAATYPTVLNDFQNQRRNMIGKTVNLHINKRLSSNQDYPSGAVILLGTAVGCGLGYALAPADKRLYGVLGGGLAGSILTRVIFF